MEIYLVGGAVRDKQLGLPVSEHDWVVVGATPEEMLSLGYTPVGKDFPVFLHPETKEEYALARTERKTGPGYTGFETRTGPNISLEQDLLRRDLTINAMAETTDGKLIDPYNGSDDLVNGILRHVSPAFSEDPVRILRLARFAARFAHMGFHVAHDTNTLMRTMVASGEVDHLVPERVWAELDKALRTKTPEQFFKVLLGCDALTRLFPEMEIASTSESQGHESNNIELPVLKYAASSSDKAVIRFAALICDIDNSNRAGLDDENFTGLCERQRIPNAYRELAGMALQCRTRVHKLAGSSAKEMLDLLNALDVFRRGERFSDFLCVCEADACSADPVLQNYAPAALLQQARQAALDVNVDTTGLSGKEIGEKIRRARTEAIEKILL
ncbi:MAG: multifunctional CCA addition/repair protein [Gammaproteobacteria bacterium]|nr:multifunctional CCA addition/repair protein [Gammaproteobacteria bacterium]